MNVNGSKAKNLTQHDARDEAPVWSPTGEHIVFHSNRHGLRDLYIMDADGRNVRKLFKDLVYRESQLGHPMAKCSHTIVRLAEAEESLWLMKLTCLTVRCDILPSGGSFSFCQPPRQRLEKRFSLNPTVLLLLKVGHTLRG